MEIVARRGGSLREIARGAKDAAHHGGMTHRTEAEVAERSIDGGEMDSVGVGTVQGPRPSRGYSGVMFGRFLVGV